MSRRDRRVAALSPSQAQGETPTLTGMANLSTTAMASEMPAPPALTTLADPDPTPPPAPTLYRVVRGNVCVGPRILSAGKVVHLTPAEAASLAGHVEPIA